MIQIMEVYLTLDFLKMGKTLKLFILFMFVALSIFILRLFWHDISIFAVGHFIFRYKSSLCVQIVSIKNTFV